MDDLISRQAVLDYIDTMPSELTADGRRMIRRIRLTEYIQDSLPSAQKTGKWIWDENGMDWGLGAWRCSECGSKPETWWESDKRNNPIRCAGSRFCGNCGARMERE